MFRDLNFCMKIGGSYNYGSRCIWTLQYHKCICAGKHCTQTIAHYMITSWTIYALHLFWTWTVCCKGIFLICCQASYLGIESHFVGVHGPYELHRKEKQIKCTALAVHENLLFFPMQFIWPVNTDKMRFNTYIIHLLANKVCCDIAYFNTKMSHLSDFKRTKSKTLRTAKQTEDELKKSAVWSSANNTNKRLTF